LLFTNATCAATPRYHDSVIALDDLNGLKAAGAAVDAAVAAAVDADRAAAAVADAADADADAGAEAESEETETKRAAAAAKVGTTVHSLMHTNHSTAHALVYISSSGLLVDYGQLD
jgi:hypothetical protein